MARRLIHSGVIYGPVRSRRFGMSLGINLSGPGKYCSFDCVYCFRGPNGGRPDEPAFRAGLPSPQQVIIQLSTRLTGHPNASGRLPPGGAGCVTYVTCRSENRGSNYEQRRDLPLTTFHSPVYSTLGRDDA